ncbi:unnamed protein product [Spirodela intermedia]|uniref:Uncharacterized protein n=1 Tax=Spirodela intermedia TaxID=51605 RepID=A0A7I8IX84_SPIIN|nr:unnamed protein product [Spirodela intermedia]CAA6662467.1 unnamed protein product [Spirodela intermedia]
MASPASYALRRHQQQRRRPLQDDNWVRSDGEGSTSAGLHDRRGEGRFGVGYAEFGSTKVIVSICPRESKKAMKYSGIGRLNCNVSFATFSTATRGSSGGRRPLESFPKTTVDVFALVLESGGSDLPAVISCASLALADAGIMMYDLVASASVSCIGNSLIIDPAAEEEDCQDGSLMVAFMPSRREITQLTLTGEWSTGRIHEATELCLDACSKLGRSCALV